MSSTFFQYLRLFRTDLLPKARGVIVSDPVRFEVFRGKRIYAVLFQPAAVILVPGGAGISLRPGTIVTEDSSTFIELKARTKEPVKDGDYCQSHLDRVMTQLSAILSPDIFNDRVWDGWLFDEGTEVAEMLFKSARQSSMTHDELARSFEGFRSGLSEDVDLQQRFLLMSKLYARASGLIHGEEKFLWLWTVLEVFPMRGTTDIAPISATIAAVTGKPTDRVKAALRIGRLFGARSDLVHNGELPGTKSEHSEVLHRLDAIVRTILRYAGRLPYDGALDTYFEPAAPVA